MKPFTTRAAATLLTLLSASAWAATSGGGAGSAIEGVQRNTEAQVRKLVEPLIDKYCQESCKLLSVTSTVDIATPEEVAPGFDEITGSAKVGELAPASARIKLLIDDKVGPVSRQKLTELLQQFLDTLDYPVKVDVQLAHFPPPVGTESRVVELRERIIKQFRGTLESMFTQFCPDQCMLADFSIQTESVNPEEAQYGKPGEFIQEGGVALKIKDISGTLLMDDLLTPEERANVLEMAKLKTNTFQNVTLTQKSLRFPHSDYMSSARGSGGNGKEAGRGLASTSSNDSKNTQDQRTTSNSNSTNSRQDSTNQNNTQTTQQKNSENNERQDKYERYEKIERVESGDAVQAELQKFKVYGLVLACAILSLLIFVAMASVRSRKGDGDYASPIARVMASLQDPSGAPAPGSGSGSAANSSNRDDQRLMVVIRYEIERLSEELLSVFSQQPKVAKQVFSRVLTEEGVETTSQYIQIFGESIVMDMLRDPSLQSDLSELMEFYAKNPQDIKDEMKLDLLKKLHNRTVAGKLFVMGNRSSNLFDFLAEMDGTQILELVRNESLTVKSIVLTQVDPSKRSAIYSQLDEETRMKLLTELSRIDYLPRDYIFNVANALKRKRKDNPKLNTEALPGSEVLVNLLERTGVAIQRTVVKNLELSNPESARVIKSKLVSLDTLKFLRDGQLLEVVLSLRHDELLQFLKAAPGDIKQAVFSKSPKELIIELEEELETLGTISRETYSGIERKVMNRMKMMANEGLINLVETNERMFAESNAVDALSGYVGGASVSAVSDGNTSSTTANIKKVAGW